MIVFLRRLLVGRQHKYALLGESPEGAGHSNNIWTRKHIGMLMMLGGLATIVGLFTTGWVAPCDMLKGPC